MDKQYDVFLSYSREDVEIMKKIQKSLEIFGFNIWTDEHIEVGTSSWKIEIEKAIRESSSLICLMSPNSSESRWVREELDFADSQNVKIYILLVQGESDSVIPFGFTSHQRIDIRNDYSPAINELIPVLCENLDVRITPKQKYMAKNPKDIRVARRLKDAIVPSLLFLSTFVKENDETKYKDTWNLFNQDFADKVGTNYPNPEILDEIMEVLCNKSFLTPSNMMMQDQAVSWFDSFRYQLQQTHGSCSEILLHYADRDDTLISLVENIRNRSKDLIFLLETNASSPELEDIYQSWSNGIPMEQYSDFVRYYYLEILKARRVIREFTNSV